MNNITTASEFDIFNSEHTQHSDAFMREQRNSNPVSRIKDDFVLVTSWKEARQVLKDSDIFSNAGGLRPNGTVIPLEDSSIGELVPPIHEPIRKIAFNAAQGPGVVEQASDFAKTTCKQQVAEVAQRGSGDLIADLSLALTTKVVAWLLGVPEEDCEQLAEWGEEIMLSPLTVTNETERGVGYAGAFPEFTEYMETMIAERLAAKDGPEDTISRILTAGTDLELTIPTIRMVLLNFLLGGTSTTRDLIGNLLHTLLTNEDLYQQLHDNRELVSAAVEESLRLTPPVLYVIRTCIQATELGGLTIEAGERVVVSIYSANRDPKARDDADSFKLDRGSRNQHIAFGFASHFCVGSQIARVESEAAVNSVLDAFPPGTLKLADNFQFKLMPLPYMLGPQSLDVTATGK